MFPPSRFTPHLLHHMLRYAREMETLSQPPAHSTGPRQPSNITTCASELPLLLRRPGTSQDSVCLVQGRL